MAAITKPQKDQFLFDEKRHAYFLDDKPMIGVTSVLQVINKPMLIQWAANMACDYIEANISLLSEEWPRIFKEARVAHRKKKEAAGELGTDVHALIESAIKNAIKQDGYITSTESGLNDQVDAFLSWAVHNHVQFLSSEQRLYSKSFWYAGTADFTCMMDGRLYVGDVKTSSAIYPEHFIQASAYAHALEEMGLHKTTDGVIIVNIPKKGGLNVKENYDLAGNFECFKAALTLHKYLNV